MSSREHCIRLGSLSQVEAEWPSSCSSGSEWDVSSSYVEDNSVRVSVSEPWGGRGVSACAGVEGVANGKPDVGVWGGVLITFIVMIRELVCGSNLHLYIHLLSYAEGDSPPVEGIPSEMDELAEKAREEAAEGVSYPHQQNPEVRARPYTGAK